MNSLSNLPFDVLTDNILPFMQISDILALGCTNKFFSIVCGDDTVWKRRLQLDYNFYPADTARTSGWQFIYRGLFRPSVYVWGETSNGRLGVSRFPKSSIHGVPFPFRLHIPGVRIVSLAAGGMSFHALDSRGRIYVWGTLDGSVFGRAEGFSNPGQEATTPHRLDMPVAMRSISCGRLHASSLDAAGDVWTFISWGRPFRLHSRLFENADSRPIQVECGWGFSAVLTNSGEVYLWWPLSGSTKDAIRQKNQELDAEGDKKAVASPDGVIPCVTWLMDIEPFRLPPIPNLPSPGTHFKEGLTQLIKVAALDALLIGLTNHGHLLVFNALESESTAVNGEWHYLPKFSELDHVCTILSDLGLESPSSIQITHISANFSHFVAYSTGSSSIVLIGDRNTTPDSTPDVVPALQNRSVISVALGDYHRVALTSDGKVLTWGAYSAGALGLGDPATLPIGSAGGYATEQWGRREIPPSVSVPSPVRFDHHRSAPKDRFCFAIASAGWHTGALVIDLDPDDSGEEKIPLEPEELPPLNPDRQWLRQPYFRGRIPPHVLSGFRVGFPGRGGFGDNGGV